MNCSHKWIIHFIDRAVTEPVGGDYKDTDKLVTDISICRLCGAVSYIWDGEVVAYEKN